MVRGAGRREPAELLPRYRAQAARARGTNYKLQVTSYKLQVTSYKLQVTSYKLQATRYKLQVTSYKFWPADIHLIGKESSSALAACSL